jgi:hypothetical protein
MKKKVNAVGLNDGYCVHAVAHVGTKTDGE